MSDLDRLNVSVRRGASISYLGFLIGKVVVFANTVFLARLLAPEHFGLVAIGLLVLTVTEAITEAGLGAAVVWRDGPLEKTASVALALSLLGGVTSAIAIVVTAPWVSSFFGDREVTPILRALALCVLVSSPAAVFGGLLQRRMAFGRRLVPDLVRAVTKGVVGIPLALAGFGVWSLVWSQIAAVAVGLVTAGMLSGWRPRLSLERNTLRDILPYVLHTVAFGLLGVAVRRVDVVIVGHRFTAESLGYYTLAFSLIELSVLGICWSASQALFPALSAGSRTPEERTEVFRRGLAAVLLITLPLSVGLAVLAEPLILATYGPKWAAVVPLMQILAFYALIYSTGFNLGDLYKATGRPQVLTWIAVINLVVALPVLTLGSRWDLHGVATGQVAVAMAISGVNWVVAARLAGIGPGVLLSCLRVPALASLVAALVCLALDRAALSDVQPLMRLLVLAGLGGTCYASLVIALVPGLRMAGRRARRRQNQPFQKLPEDEKWS